MKNAACINYLKRHEAAHAISSRKTSWTMWRSLKNTPRLGQQEETT